MPLLRYKDYKQLIQDRDLQQILQDDDQIRLQIQAAAESEVSGHLAQRYRVDKIFSATTEFDITATYYGKSLVEYTAPTFLTATTYSTNNRVVYSGYVYSALSGSSGVTPGSTGATYTWSSITEDKTLYYANTPHPEYKITTAYAAGQQVWFDDVVYTCAAPSTGKIPGVDSQYWSVGAAYSFSGEYPENSTYWTRGDNRNPQLIQILLDVTLYHLFSRLCPKLITELRMLRYNGGNDSGGAKRWLRDVAKGLIVADLPTILPTTGLSITWGYSSLRDTNAY